MKREQSDGSTLQRADDPVRTAPTRDGAVDGNAHTAPAPVAPPVERSSIRNEQRTNDCLENNHSDLIAQNEIGKTMGLPWRHARAVLASSGIEVLADGPRRWFVRRADWQAFRQRLAGSKPSPMAGRGAA